MIKLILWFNLKKLIVNKEIEREYFIEKQKTSLGKNLDKLSKKIEKLKEKKDDKSVVEVSKLEADYQKYKNIQDTLKKFDLEIEYFTGLKKTVTKNFFKWI